MTLCIETAYKGKATARLIGKAIKSSFKEIRRNAKNVNWETLIVKVDEETFPKEVTVVIVMVEGEPR